MKKKKKKIKHLEHSCFSLMHIVEPLYYEHFTYGTIWGDRIRGIEFNGLRINTIVILKIRHNDCDHPSIPTTSFSLTRGRIRGVQLFSIPFQISGDNSHINKPK